MPSRQTSTTTSQPSQRLSFAQGYGRRIIPAVLTSLILKGPPPKDKYQRLKEEHSRTRDELKQAKATIKNNDRELRGRAEELCKANHDIEQLRLEKQRMKDVIGSLLQNEPNNIHGKVEDGRTLPDVLDGQDFSTEADTLSISEVGEKVAALNEEIYQAAATLAEALIRKRHKVSPRADLVAADAECQDMVGEKITNLLISQSRKPVNPLLVQVVLQILLVNFCASKIRSWYSSNTAIGEFLTATYFEIRSTEEQAVSGRWRALTRAHTRPSTERWTTELYQKLTSVLKIAAWMPSSPENQESFTHCLPSIFKAVNELRTAIGEKITSADLDIAIFDCDTTYDPSIMDNAYSDVRQPSGKRSPGAIIGTTGIGLKKVTVGCGAQNDAQFQTVISAKVVLISTLKGALEPVRSSKKFDGSNQDGRG